MNERRATTLRAEQQSKSTDLPWASQDADASAYNSMSNEMRTATKAALLVTIVASCSSEAKERLEPGDAPTLYAIATAKSAAVRVIDETAPDCWERDENFGRSATARLRQDGFEIVDPEDRPDLLLIVNPKATLNDDAACAVELYLRLQINNVRQANRAATRSSEIAAIIAGSVSEWQGSTARFDSWIQLQSDIFADAVVFARREANRIMGMPGFRWRITRLKHELISSNEAVRRHIDLCGSDGRLSTVRNGVRFADIYFVKCMRDMTYEVRYDDDPDFHDCEWLVLSSKRSGYHGELRCGPELPQTRHPYSAKSPER